MQFSFLVYAARSGSTFLAMRLAEASLDLVVVPEFRLPYFLLVRSEREVEGLGADGLTRLMEMDPQLGASLGLEPETIGRIAAAAGRGGTRRIVEEVVGTFRAGHGLAADHAVIKLGGALSFPARLAEAFPEARFVHLVRDGRGVVASLLHTEKAFFPGEDMGRGDVVHCAKGWGRHLSQVRRAEETGIRTLTVRYEELAADPEQEIGRVVEFLGASPAGSPGPSYFAVSEAEAGLHRNVEGPARADRARAWESSLRPWQGLAVEWWSRRWLDEWGYGLSFLPGSSRRRRAAAIAWAWLVHLAASGRYVLRRLVRMWREPRRFVEMARLRLARWRA